MSFESTMQGHCSIARPPLGRSTTRPRPRRPIVMSWHDYPTLPEPRGPMFVRPQHGQHHAGSASSRRRHARICFDERLRMARQRCHGGRLCSPSGGRSMRRRRGRWRSGDKRPGRRSRSRGNAYRPRQASSMREWSIQGPSCVARLRTYMG